MCHLDDPRAFVDQIELCRQRGWREAPAQILGEGLDVVTGCGHLEEGGVEFVLGIGVKARVVLDGVGDPAQQIGVGD
jgi:hypothetical protein